MRRAWWTIGVASVLVVSGVPGPGPPPARAHGYPYNGGSYVPAPGNVYRGPGYYTYYYDPGPGYRYPVLRSSYGPPMEYASLPRYSYRAPRHTGGYSPTPWYSGRYRPGGILRSRGRDRGPYPY